MHQIIWKEEFLTGVEEIDRQHQEFVKLINRLNIIQGYGDKGNYALRLMDEVGKYAEYHFASEENIMYLTEHPHLDDQQKMHKALILKYRQWTESYKNHKAEIEDIIRFLEGWFTEHTINQDKKIGVFVKKK
ncbi:MAG TPA: bacteriohemerythrin [Smithellaceae bacterium]|nr:bacteriohemerythrin [Smithellaceae bacterium]